MIARTCAAALLLGTTLSVAADVEPNLNPGMWEHTSTMTFDSEFPIPDQTETNSECLTEEEIKRGDAFMEDMDECEMTQRDMRADGMDYAMTCRAADGTQVNMAASMEFHGDTANGVITGNMDTPMGPISMNIRIEGRRTGDC
jgi:hypothetical protein